MHAVNLIVCLVYKYSYKHKAAGKTQPAELNKPVLLINKILHNSKRQNKHSLQLLQYDQTLCSFSNYHD